jgi:DNA-binding transcriptional LysR family regulator
MIRTDDLFSGVLPFFHAAEERSFRKAAERLSVTPAAVSKAVLKLEETLGVKLLVRTSRTVALTPEGATFLERCREAIGSLQAGRELVSASRRLPKGPVHASLPFILGRIVGTDLPRIAARYPNLDFRLTFTDRLVKLADESIDVAVRIGTLQDSSLVARQLRTSRWVTVAAPSYLSRRGTPAEPGQLGVHDCLQFMTPQGKPRALTFHEPRSGETLVKGLTPRLLVDQGDVMLSAAVGGLGICQVLDFMVQGHLERGELVELLAEYAAPGPPITALTTPERSRSANVKAFMAFLVETFGRLEARGPRT